MMEWKLAMVEMQAYSMNKPITKKEQVKKKAYNTIAYKYKEFGEDQKALSFFEKAGNFNMCLQIAERMEHPKLETYKKITDTLRRTSNNYF